MLLLMLEECRCHKAAFSAYFVSEGKRVFDTDTGESYPYVGQAVANIFEWQGNRLFINLGDGKNKDRRWYNLLSGGPEFKLELGILKVSLGGLELKEEGYWEEGTWVMGYNSFLPESCFLAFWETAGGVSCAMLYGFDMRSRSVALHSFMVKDGICRKNGSFWEVPQESPLRRHYVRVDLEAGVITGQLRSAVQVYNLSIPTDMQGAGLYDVSVSRFLDFSGYGSFLFLTDESGVFYWSALSVAHWGRGRIITFVVLKDSDVQADICVFFGAGVYTCVVHKESGLLDVFDFMDNEALTLGYKMETLSGLTKLALMGGDWTVYRG